MFTQMDAGKEALLMNTHKMRFLFSPLYRIFLVFCPCAFQTFNIAITSLAGKRTGLCAFLASVCFARVGLCLFPFPLCVSDWLRLMYVALPGLSFFT